MSSQRKIDSCRANGAKSHGPVTPAGLTRCQMAAITHGLTSHRVLLDHESKDEYNTLRETCFAFFQPRNSFENDLVEQFVASRWRMDRAWSVETALLDVQVAQSRDEVDKKFDNCDPQTRTALAFRAIYDGSRIMTGLGRYESRYRRICDKIVKLFEAIRRIQKLSEGPNPKNEHL